MPRPPSAEHPFARGSTHHDCSIGCTVSSLLHHAGTFFSQLADLHWIPLLIGLAAYGVYLLIRSRASCSSSACAASAR